MGTGLVGERRRENRHHSGSKMSQSRVRKPLPKPCLLVISILAEVRGGAPASGFARHAARSIAADARARFPANAAAPASGQQAQALLAHPGPLPGHNSSSAAGSNWSTSLKRDSLTDNIAGPHAILGVGRDSCSPLRTPKSQHSQNSPPVATLSNDCAPGRLGEWSPARLPTTWAQDAAG